MKILCLLAASAIVLGFTVVASLASGPMKATILISSGALYDYVIIGEDSRATDGYDNAYDTISPGNLNEAMGEPFITAVLLHPEWKAPLRELRGEIRSVAAQQKWRLSVRSSLPEGTPLNLSLQREETALPQGMKLIVADAARNEQKDLLSQKCIISAPGPGRSKELTIAAVLP